MSMVKPIPDGFHSLTPYLVVKGGADAIEFYKKALGAEELYRHVCEKTDRIMNAKLRIGTSLLMLNDEIPEFGCFGPGGERPSPVTLHLYVEDVDSLFQRAIDAGGEATMPVSDTFWGDRYGQFRDPFGHSWSIATHKEDLTDDEIRERMKHAMS